MTGWDMLVYFSVGVVYFSVVATTVGLVKYVRSDDFSK